MAARSSHLQLLRGLGSPGFAPGIARAKAAGVKAHVSPYPPGEAGIKISLATVKQKAVEGSVDPAIIEWVAQVFRAKGIDGRDRPSVRTQVSALLEELQSAAIYLPDALGREVIQSAAATLCLRPGLCLRSGDCDDLTVALAAATVRCGIPTRLVHQIFSGSGQEHVLLQVQDERGMWVYADPSTKLPLGQAHHADKEEYIDVMDGVASELVTIGAPDTSRPVVMLGRPHALPQGHPGTSHPLPSGARHKRFASGRWWGWSGTRWELLAPGCTSWSEPIDPPADLLAEAVSQLAASGGAPVSEAWTDGATYLFTREANRGMGPQVAVRACLGPRVAGLHRTVGAPPGLGDTRVAWASLVMSEIKRVDAIWQATNNDATACSVAGKIAANVFADWGVQLANWNAFVVVNNDLSSWQFGLGALLDQVEGYEKLVYDWQQNLKAAGCVIGAPIEKPIPEKDKPMFGPIFAEGTAGDLDRALGAIEKVLIGGAVVAAVGTGLWLAWPWLAALRSHAPAGRAPQPAHANPLSSGEAVAVGVGVVALGGIAIYFATRTSTAATPAKFIFQQGHEYKFVNTSAPSAASVVTAASAQQVLDTSNPGVFKVVSYTMSGTTLTMVLDVIGPVPANLSAGLTPAATTTIQDLGPIPTP